MIVRASDFRLTFGGTDFKLAGVHRPGLPILRWPSGALCHPVIAYFSHSARVQRVRVSSMKDEAYAIREWLAFLTTNGKRWYEADDALLRRWKEQHHDSVVRGAIEARRVERKIHCVFEFYQRLPDALPFDERGQLQRLYVGKANPREGISFPITSKTPFSPGDRVADVWSGAERHRKQPARRPTPSEFQVDKLLTWLRAKPDRRVSLRSGSRVRDLSVLESERNWLIGRCMVDGGLRAGEVTSLTLDALLKALRSESILSPREVGPTSPAARHVLDRTSSKAEARAKILAGLDAMQAAHRDNLYVEITGKGRKTRNAPFSIDLVRDLLEVGVWTVRQNQLDCCNARRMSESTPRHVFLSFKTGTQMTAGAVSDLMKSAFNAVGIAGSGHRLRAYYATQLAVRLWSDAYARNGYRHSKDIEDQVLLQLAEALGHSSVDTVVRYYLDLAQTAVQGASTRKKRDGFVKIRDALIRFRNTLSPLKLELIYASIEALAGLPDGSPLAELFEMGLADPELKPERTVGLHKGMDTPKRQPYLRVVN